MAFRKSDAKRVVMAGMRADERAEQLSADAKLFELAREKEIAVIRIDITDAKLASEMKQSLQQSVGIELQDTGTALDGLKRVETFSDKAGYKIHREWILVSNEDAR